MSLKIQLSDKLGALVTQMRAHVDLHPEGFGPEAQAKFDSIEADISATEKQIENVKKVEAREASLQTVPVLPNVNGAAANVGDREAHEEKVKASFRKYLMFGNEGIDAADRAILQQRYVRDNGEVANPQMAQTITTTGGGYLVPTGFANKIEVAEKFFGGIASVAETMLTESGQPLPYPTANDTATKATILGINTTASEADIVFGNLIFNAYKFTSGIIQVPYELLQDSYFDLDTFVASKFGERFGRAKNFYGTVGTGSSQPTGVMVALAAAPQNLVLGTGNTVTITGDNLIDLEHSVDVVYRPGAKYMLNDATLKILRKLKDAQNRYLWLPAIDGGFAGGNPATLNGYPYVVNNDMATPAANAYTIAFGELTKFKVRQVSGYIMLRLNERYADNGQVAFIAFQRWDSNLIDAGTHPVAALQQSAT